MGHGVVPAGEGRSQRFELVGVGDGAASTRTA